MNINMLYGFLVDDDYYTTYERAKKDYDEWIEQGYDDDAFIKTKGE
jgi:hypothetical protein